MESLSSDSSVVDCARLPYRRGPRVLEGVGFTAMLAEAGDEASSDFGNVSLATLPLDRLSLVLDMYNLQAHLFAHLRQPWLDCGSNPSVKGHLEAIVSFAQPSVDGNALTIPRRTSFIHCAPRIGMCLDSIAHDEILRSSSVIRQLGAVSSAPECNTLTHHQCSSASSLSAPPPLCHPICIPAVRINSLDGAVVRVERQRPSRL